MDVLRLYATLEGQTAKIAQYVAQTLRNCDQYVAIHTIAQLPVNFTLDVYDAIIIGAPVHMGQYPKLLKIFARQHHDWLNQHPSALYTVCMAINSQRPESRQQAAGYVEKFLGDTQWQPTQTITLAGAIKYTRYGFVTRYIMKRIARREGNSTDTTRDHEYTDWEAVTRFAQKFAGMLASYALTD